MKRFFSLMLVPMLILMLSGCDKEDNNNNPIDPGPQPDPPPAFNLSAQPVTLNTGDDGLAFYAFCMSCDINLVKVVVKNPRGESVTYNASNTLILQDQEFECQIPGTGYYKYLGTWRLTFVGNRATGSKESFSVTNTINVSGKIK